MDANVKGPLYRVATRGVLHNHNGNWICAFAVRIGQELADGAEIKAVLHGLNRV